MNLEHSQLPPDLSVGGDPSKNKEGTHLVARLTWALFGPTIFLCLLVPMAREHRWFGMWEGAYLATIVLMMLGRYVEQTTGNAKTLYDEPSTWRHVIAYFVKLFIAGVLLFVAAKYFGRHPLF